MIEIVLGGAVIILSGAVFYLVTQQEEPDIDVEVDPDKVRGAVSESWQNLKLDEKIGSVEKQMENVQSEAEKIQDLHRDIETMLANPQERGEFGERKLEDLLARHLPSDMYGTQETVVGRKKPDAYIQSSAGKICIDSKFPLESFRRMQEAEDEKEKQKHSNKFRRAVKKQLQEVKKKYVKPEKGTTDYAFEFVPSETVYYYLVREEYELLNEYTREGVQVVSPLTLGHKLELVKSDVKTAQLSKEAEKVKSQLQSFENSFRDVFDEWSTFYKHVRNSKKKADDVESSLERLEDEFESVNRLEN
ncbi:DNA recombination protein RmuC [Candidatus Nanohalococcus occultus]|uniref:DNA recombination protein RmuC n=1 Tax=Candidatus Nanohalococcus occultus TaxID=2978047 RepID=A0ABY8CJ02_9ARCH|nr:DNA recombination protein RmuC [Candidatus Nanohaloarchaeota archaeon SVXNc]